MTASPGLRTIANAQKGQSRAQMAVISHLKPLINSLCARKAARAHLAEDVTQSCYVAILEELPNYNPELGGLRSYFYPFLMAAANKEMAIAGQGPNVPHRQVARYSAIIREAGDFEAALELVKAGEHTEPITYSDFMSVHAALAGGSTIGTPQGDAGIEGKSYLRDPGKLPGFDELLNVLSTDPKSYERAVVCLTLGLLEGEERRTQAEAAELLGIDRTTVARTLASALDKMRDTFSSLR